MRFQAFHCSGLSLPAEGEGGVEELPPARGPIPCDREVGDESHEQKECGDGAVGGDRKRVPHQRALEVDPKTALVRVGQDEIRLPDPADVDAEKLCRREHGEHGHGFRTAVDGVPPLRTKQVEDGGDQRAGVRDTDPEHEGHDVDAPEDGVRIACDAQALVHLVDPDRARGMHEHHQEPEEQPVRHRRAVHHRQDVAVHLRVCDHRDGADHVGNGGGRRRRHRLDPRRVRGRPSPGRSSRGAY